MGVNLAGYGAQTALFTPKLKEHYDLTVSAFYGLEGSVLKYGDIEVLPGMTGTYGNEIIQSHASSLFGGLREGMVVTLMDVWVLEPNVWKNLNAASWVPVDHAPPPPGVLKFLTESGVVPIAMSKFGEKQLAEFDSLYVPHGVDTTAYKPVNRKKARNEIGLPRDAFVVGMVAANKGNPSRKCIPEALQAFKAFSDRHDDARLYLHMEVTGRFDGVNIPRLIAALGLQGKVHVCDQYRCLFAPLQPKQMASTYSAFDVLLNPSAGEGFGIPIVEAQACGVPAIVTDFSAMSELCGAGWLVEHTPTYTPQMSWQARPVVEDIVNALEQCYGLADAKRQQCKERARQFALQYDADKVMEEHFLPALETAQERFEERKPAELVAA